MSVICPHIYKSNIQSMSNAIKHWDLYINDDLDAVTKSIL